MAKGPSIATAVLTLTTDMTQFVSDLGDAEKRAAGFTGSFTQIGKDFSAVGKSFTSFGKDLSTYVTLPIVGVIGGLTSMAVTAASAGDAIAESARTAGTSAGAYQSIVYALEQVSDLAGDEVTKALSKLTLTIGSAVSGSKPAIAALEALGFSQAEIASGAITTEEAFSRFVAAMSKAESPAKAAALAGDLVGDKLGPRLSGALMASGGEVEALRQKFDELGLGMSDDALEAAQAFDDELKTVQLQLGAVGREIGAAVLPMLVSLMTRFRDDGIPILKAFAERIGAVIEWFSNLPGPVQAVIGVVVGLAAALGPVLVAVGAVATAIGAALPVIAAIGAALGALATGPVLAIGAAIVGLVAIWRNWDTIVAIFTTAKDAVIRIAGELIAGVRGWLVEKFNAIVESIKAKIDAVTGFFQGMYESVVGSSFVPDMVNGIATEFGRLDSVMVNPAQAAIQGVERLFGGLQTTVMGHVTGLLSALPAFIGGPLAGLVASGLTKLGGLVIDGVKKLGGAIGGFFKNLFGGPNADELAGREIVRKFEDNIASMLNERQKVEAGNESWKKTVIMIRDAYIILGKSEADAQKLAEELWASSKKGAASAQVAVGKVEDVFKEVDKKVNDTGKTFDQLRDEALNAGKGMNTAGQQGQQAASKIGGAVKDKAIKPTNEFADALKNTEFEKWAARGGVAGRAIEGDLSDVVGKLRGVDSELGDIGWSRFESKGKSAADAVRERFEKLNKEIDATSFGHSPGGLEDAIALARTLGEELTLAADLGRERFRALYPTIPALPSLRASTPLLDTRASSPQAATSRPFGQAPQAPPMLHASIYIGEHKVDDVVVATVNRASEARRLRIDPSSVTRGRY